MLSDLFYMLVINIALIVSFIYILNRIKPFFLSPNSTIKVKILYSVGFVALSIVTMHFKFSDKGIVIDFRFVPVMVAGFFGGPITGSVTGLLVGLYRLLQHPTKVTVIMFIGSIILGFVIGLFAEYRYRKNELLAIPALAGTALLIVFGLIMTRLKISQVPSNAHILIGILHPLVFIFMVLVFKDMIRINEHRKQLEREATMDGMTGLFNFRYFDNTLKEILASAIKRSEKLTVAFVDIDFFKKVNDTYGHQAGDEVLRQLGEVIRHSLRPFDVAARYGGEEFAAILPGCDQENALNVGERIRRNVENKVFHVGVHRLKITVSVGVTTFPDYAQDDDDLVRQSDIALYRAKQTGRNKVVCYSDMVNEADPR